MVPSEIHTSPKRSIRPKRTPRWAGWAVVAALAITAIVLLFTPNKNDDQKDLPIPAEAPKGKLVSYPGRTFSYTAKFNDQQKKQLRAAEAVGIRPCSNEKEVMKQKNKLKRISSCRNYMVDDLTHSLPYLTRNAAEELEVIGNEFADILERNNLPHYRFIITSILRTDESVGNLKKSGNINATKNSTHRYGTTFDITYKRFDKRDKNPDYMSEENLKLVLGQALLNEQRAGHIYVKYEYKQACFHITCRK